MEKDYVAGLVERLGAFRMRFDLPMSEDDFMAHWAALRESRTTLTAQAAALAEKDAEIARAVNSHADLVAALETCAETLDAMSEYALTEMLEGTVAWDRVAGKANMYGALDKARAAIAKAKES